MTVCSGGDRAALELAAQTLAAGGLVGMPTETVYGLAARADDDAATARIFAAKGRPIDHPLIVHVGDAAAAQPFVEGPLPAAAAALMRAFWPGPMTLVLARRHGIAQAAAGGLPTVALRCPDHPVAQALLHAAWQRGVRGVAAPSANRFGRVSPTRAAHVAAEFGPSLLVLDGGACREGIESTIIDCTAPVPTVLRPGTLTRGAIEGVLGHALAAPGAAAPRVSGSLASHYAPAAQVVLAPRAALPAALAGAARQWGAAMVAGYARGARPEGAGTFAGPWRALPDDARAAAHELFDALRAFDAQGMRAVVIEQPPDDPAWDGVRDRLQRAAAR